MSYGMWCAGGFWSDLAGSRSGNQLHLLRQLAVSSPYHAGHAGNGCWWVAAWATRGHAEYSMYRGRHWAMTVFTREPEQATRHTRLGFPMEYDPHSASGWFSVGSFMNRSGLLEVGEPL